MYVITSDIHMGKVSKESGFQFRFVSDNGYRLLMTQNKKYYETRHRIVDIILQLGHATSQEIFENINKNYKEYDNFDGKKHKIRSKRTIQRHLIPLLKDGICGKEDDSYYLKEEYKNNPIYFQGYTENLVNLIFKPLLLYNNIDENTMTDLIQRLGALLVFIFINCIRIRESNIIFSIQDVIPIRTIYNNFLSLYKINENNSNTIIDDLDNYLKNTCPSIYHDLKNNKRNND